ncbi:MAG: toll/interleukin-1 receptor domain-containing protein [Anaerolineaceae bacterium]|nr:toll/interleukin-1 receptor domain-containing protein [Anaerolineaceae bacterium]
MSHVFISYSKQNKDYARQLVNKLRDEGFDVWIDDRELRASVDWWRSIVLALRSCGAFIVIMTPESDSSDWVQREITLALKYDKPIFPLWLAGSLDTPNWELFVRTQYTDVRGGKLPEENFFVSLGEAAARRSQRGENVTQTHKVDKVNFEDEDEVFQQAIANPPAQSLSDVFSPADEQAQSVSPLPAKPGLWRLWPIATLVLVVAALTLFIVANPPVSQPESTPDSSSVTDTPEPEETAAPPLDILNDPASIEALNTWREANEYVPLTEDATLQALAQRHLNYLLSILPDALPATNLYVDDAGRDIQTVAAEAGYASTEDVAMFVEVRDGNFPLDDLLLQLQIQGNPDLQANARYYGLAQERSIDTDKLYFILIIGSEG